jgi:hypothetical protein
VEVRVVSTDHTEIKTRAKVGVDLYCYGCNEELDDDAQTQVSALCIDILILLAEIEALEAKRDIPIVVECSEQTHVDELEATVIVCASEIAELGAARDRWADIAAKRHEIVCEVNEQVKAKQAAIDRVLALHVECTCAGGLSRCHNCGDLWPCETVRALTDD